jgi:nucleotide-binding universal stress UspA family protein
MTSARPQRGGIVCGVDGSAHARLAAKAALSLADRLGTRLTLVHVAPVRTLLAVASLPADVDLSAYPGSVEIAEVQAAESFRALSSELNRPDVVRKVRLGEPATVLAELAAENAAEFIVVGSRGRGVWRSAALGSVSAELVRLACCPVMIVPELALEKQRTA